MLTAEQQQTAGRLTARRAEVAALPARRFICPHCLVVYLQLPYRHHGRCPKDNHRIQRREAILTDLDQALRWYRERAKEPA